jgi:hypothetical protein
MTGKGGENIGKANKMRVEREILTMAQEWELCGREPGIKDSQSIPMMYHAGIPAISFVLL